MNAAIDIEKIATQIHEFYFSRYGGFLPAKFCDLPEYMKEDNRAAARRIGSVLSVAALSLVLRKRKHWSNEDKESVRAIMRESIEVLAEAEHDGWVETRLRHGWKLAPTKPTTEAERRANFDARLHHLLITYDQLPEKDKTKDRAVLDYVDIISETDYRIVPQNKG